MFLTVNLTSETLGPNDMRKKSKKSRPSRPLQAVSGRDGDCVRGPDCYYSCHGCCGLSPDLQLLQKKMLL